MLTALLCSCGGGGGSTPPAPTPAPTASAPPTAAPAVSIPVGAAAVTAPLGSVNGQSASVAFPATSAGSGTIGAQLSATLPAGLPVVESTARLAAAARAPRAIGTTPLSTLLFMTFAMPAVTLSFTSSPAFTFVFPAGFALAAGSQAYVALYDPTQPALGWQMLLGPGTVTGETITFASVPLNLKFQPNQTYVFALYANGPVVTPSPSPSPSPSPTGSPSPLPTATTFPGGGSLVANLTTNYPAAARSAVFTFSPASGTGPLSNLVALPSGCGAAPPCSVTLSAPAGANQSIQTLLYASTNGSGTALAVGSGTASFVAGAATTYNFALSGIMATFTVSLSPANVTVGQATPINVTENALDAAGETLATGYVTTGLTTPVFTVSVTDSTGTSGVEGPGAQPYYSGVGYGPVAYVVQTPNYPSASASPTFTAASAPSTVGFALDTLGTVCTVALYPPLGTSPSRTYMVPCPKIRANPQFDPNGTLWGATVVGINPNATSAGAFGPAGTLLTFDRSGKSYVADPTVSAVDVYSGTTLTRQFNVPSTPSAAAVDLAGNVYVGTRGTLGVSEYAASGSGNIAPTATNATAYYYPATDPSGNLYLITGSGVGIWPPGTFGPNAPPQTIVPPAGDTCCNSYSGIAADAAGNVYGVGTLPNPNLFATTQSMFSSLPNSGTFVPFSPSTFMSCDIIIACNFSMTLVSAPIR